MKSNVHSFRCCIYFEYVFRLLQRFFLCQHIVHLKFPLIVEQHEAEWVLELRCLSTALLPFPSPSMCMSAPGTLAISVAMLMHLYSLYFSLGVCVCVCLCLVDVTSIRPSGGLMCSCYDNNYCKCHKLVLQLVLNVYISLSFCSF